MKNLLLHIEYLVHCHDCVTLPGFGAFIATNLPALVDDSRQLFMPPTRYISFNSEITHNDGLIAASFARRDGISFEAASADVEKAVDRIRREIARFGVVDLGAVGTLKADTQGLLQFIPAKCTDIFNPYSILAPIDLKTEDSGQVAANTPQHKPRLIRLGTNAMRVAASVAITVSLGALLFFPLRDSSALPIVKAAIWPSSVEADAPVYTFVERPQPDIELLFAEAPAEIENKVEPAEEHIYGVVVGVFSSQEKAESFIGNRQNLSIRPTGNGLVRVYAATTATKEESTLIASRLRASGEWPEAWPAKIR